MKQVETQVKLLRPVKQVLIGDDVGPDMVSIAVKTAAQSPYTVLFPSRYSEGAERYAEEFPDIPVAVLGQRNQNAPEGIIYILTDTATDFYRAGRYAAIFSEVSSNIEENAEDNDEQGKIVVLQKTRLNDDTRQIFLDGLEAQGYEEDPQYTMASSNYNTSQKASAVVMLGQAGSFLDQNIKAPVILFSWIDPEVTSSFVKIIFDDSVWALAVPAAKAAVQGEDIALPSVVILSSKRTEEAVLRKLKEASAGKHKKDEELLVYVIKIAKIRKKGLTKFL